MGDNEALEPQEELVIEAVEATEDAPVEEGAEVVEEAVENEIVLDGEEGSQPDKYNGWRKRINGLNSKIDKAKAKATDADRRAEIAEEKAKLLQMALDQQKNGTPVPNFPPDPNEYDDGARDAKYIEALNAYNSTFIQAEVQKHTSQVSQQQQSESANSQLHKMQEKHYERAEGLAISDFEETEDKAIDALGKDVTNELIKASDNSHLILYYLGKNPSKAEHFAELVKTNPLKATMELGALGAKLSVKPKAKAEPTPDPDEELEGGTPASAQVNSHQRAYNKAVDKGDMKAVIAARKAANAAGVTIVR